VSFVVLLWFFCGSFVVLLWFFYGSFMVLLWFFYGSFMVLLCDVIESVRIVTGRSNLKRAAIINVGVSISQIRLSTHQITFISFSQTSRFVQMD